MGHGHTTLEGSDASQVPAIQPVPLATTEEFVADRILLCQLGLDLLAGLVVVKHRRA